MNFTIGELLQATGGLLHLGLWNTPAGRICTDTRTLQPGETFVALSGKNYRGIEFIPEALARGAAGVLACSTLPADYPRDRFYIEVQDTQAALGDIAREWRRVVNPKVVAVSGSAGKTTTKEMTAHICRPYLQTLANEGNLNNLIGLPITLLRLQEQHELAIIEVGMNQPGELTRLTELCIPDIAIITNVGNAHIGNFGSLKGLIAGEGEILRAMSEDGTAIINADCPHASMMAEVIDRPNLIISYGQHERADVQALNVRLAQPYGYEFDLRFLDEVLPVRLNVFGRYQVYNALAAAAAALHVGIEPEQIVERLEEFDPPRLRSQAEWIDGIFIIADCYNASPDATMTALRSMQDVSGLERRVALLGDMLELGEFAEQFHRQVGAVVAEAKFDLLCTVGEMSRITSHEAEKRGVAVAHFASSVEAAEFLSSELRSNDGLVVKGSRGVRLEEALRAFRELRSAIRNGEVSRKEVDA
jgi:UDP-N-acetylmuramoyl-tripeptide--D-alanyl-D-alanine ligase